MISSMIATESLRISEKGFGLRAVLQSRDVTAHVQSVHERVVHLDGEWQQRALAFLDELAEGDLALSPASPAARV